MDIEVREKFRRILFEMKKQIVANPPPRVAAECSRGDDVDVLEHQRSNRLAAELCARNAVTLRRIEAALKRLNTGQFGQCTECEEPIEERRLESRPITTLCALCKEDEERMQVTYSGRRRRSA